MLPAFPQLSRARNSLFVSKNQLENLCDHSPFVTGFSYNVLILVFKQNISVWSHCSTHVTSDYQIKGRQIWFVAMCIDHFDN